ncbi:hypothetical protein DL96DRAFT_3029 [Flagelloscypha sp. PMI_526]|nr:hypothetical protein DL96DRAFT_3029 [Flagelloscypha sp. PMI_526]
MAGSIEAEDVILILFALFFPPGTALLISGCGSDLVINLILTFLFWFPGTLHAFWLIYQKIRNRQHWLSGRHGQLTFAKI